MARALSNDQKQQMLERLAYQAWLNRGCPQGSPLVDWHQAINILNTQFTLFGSEQASTPSPQKSIYGELGNDEDTPADSASLSPFAARAKNPGLNGGSGANSARLAKPQEAKRTDDDPKRGKRGPKRK
jgi:hypothetical protein